MAHQNVTSCDPLNNKGNSNPVENSPDQDSPCVLRRSSRLKVGRDGAKCTDGMSKMPEWILPKILGSEDQTNKNSSTENFRYATNLYLSLQVCYSPYRKFGAWDIRVRVQFPVSKEFYFSELCLIYLAIVVFI